MDQERIIFHLARFWPPEASKNKQKNLYEEIKCGNKTSEWRKNNKYWRKRLLRDNRPSKAWFVIRYPKGSLPRVEADISDIIVHEESGQIEVKFVNVKEILSLPPST